MKRIFMLCMLIGITLASLGQTDTTKQQTDTTRQESKTDTIHIGGMVIIRDKDKKDKKVERDGIPYIRERKRDKPSNLSTNWWIFDIGFSHYTDNTNYASAEAQGYAPGANENWFDLKYGKSRNVNIWFFMQRLNMIKHVVNLKYGLGLELNNYYYELPVRYIAGPPPNVVDPPRVFLDNTANRSYKKSKLAADFLTVPMMLNFNFTPQRHNGCGFSAGISAGYMYSARNKTKTSDEGVEKAKDDFDLERWKLSYVAELSLGPVRFYGSYALDNMYKRGLDMTPYTFGFRFSNW